MKFMLLQYYGGVEGLPPMSEWTPEEGQAHIDFQLELNAELRESGELIEAQALTAPELAKFDALPQWSRLYDNGEIRIYQVGG